MPLPHGALAQDSFNVVLLRRISGACGSAAGADPANVARLCRHSFQWTSQRQAPAFPNLVQTCLQLPTPSVFVNGLQSLKRALQSEHTTMMVLVVHGE